MRADRLDVIVFSLLLVLLAPTLMWIAERVASHFSDFMGRFIHAGLLGVLFGLVIWQAMASATVGTRAYLLVLLVAMVIAALYLFSQFARVMAGLMSFAAPAVVLTFWFTTPAVSLVLPQSSTSSTTPGNGTPVVMVVLDEFPLAAIEQAPSNIAADEFPNFAKLARQSTWYSNAHTVADVTPRAIPALVAGRINDSGSAPPDSTDYPDNLFNLMDGAGYSVNASESIADLCRHDVCPERGSMRSRLSRMILDGSSFGQPLPDNLAVRIEQHFLQASSVEIQPSPRDAAESFIASLEPDENTLSYSHLLLPHIPWIYLPNGQDYPGPIASGLSARTGPDGHQTWVGPRSQVDSEFQRMELQTAFVDREIGRIIKRMKSQDSWYQALFVVTADHGGSFAVGQQRRYLNDGNAGWIMPVPMFVKYPSQMTGRTVRKPVDSFDLLPTIFQTTGIEPPDGLEGMPFSQVKLSSDPFSALSTSTGEFSISRRALHDASDAAVDYRNEAFPDGSLVALAGHSGLLGRQATKIKTLDRLDAVFDSPWPEATISTDSDQVPAYLSGTIQVPVDDRTSLAISLNGRIAGTFRSWTEADLHRFVFTLPPKLFINGTNRVELFRVR